MRAWAGACTDSGFVISAEIFGPADARLAVDLDDSFSSPTFGSLVSNTDGWTKLEISGLDPNTEYHWAIELNSTLEADPRGVIKTFPPAGQATSFVFAAGSCNETGSNAVTFSRILDRDPTLFVHMGDLHYSDISSNNPQAFRNAYATTLDSPGQAALYQNVPIMYMWDDHDYSDNNSDSSSNARPAALSVYREVVPHYPISFTGDPDDTPISHTWVCGRVRFVALDTRSEAVLYEDPAGQGSILGTEQLNWLLDIIENFTELLLVINVSVPWIIIGGDVTQTDNWGHAAAEREAVSNAIQDHARGRVLLIHGDAHMVAMDDGTNTNFASSPDGNGPPLFCFAPLHRSNSTKGGPYSEGTFTSSNTQYGIVDIQDDGGDITVTGRGFRSDTDAELVSLAFVVESDGAGAGGIEATASLSGVGPSDGILWGDWSGFESTEDPGGILWGDWSGFVFATSTAEDPPNLFVTFDGSTAQLTWDASPTPGVVDYHVFRRSPQTGEEFDPAVDTPVATGIEQTSYDDEGLDGDYDWQVFGRIPG